MDSFDQNIPFPAIIAGFICLFILVNLLQRKLKNRERIREGQLPTVGTRVPTVEERVAGNSAWSSGVIRSTGVGPVIILWVLAVTWNLTFGFSFIKAISNPAMKTAPTIVLGLFSIGGFVPIYFAMRATIRQFRYGRSLCVIHGKAGVLDKVMTGTIKTVQDVEATGDYTIELQCVESYNVGSGKSRRTETKIHFQGNQNVPHVGKSTRIGIPFSFNLPKYPPETGYQLARGTICWQLSIKAPVKGVDYSAMFIVPVFNNG